MHRQFLSGLETLQNHPRSKLDEGDGRSRPGSVTGYAILPHRPAASELCFDRPGPLDGEHDLGVELLFELNTAAEIVDLLERLDRDTKERFPAYPILALVRTVDHPSYAAAGLRPYGRDIGVGVVVYVCSTVVHVVAYMMPGFFVNPNTVDNR